MLKEITLYTCIVGHDKGYAETSYHVSTLDMSTAEGYILVGKQTVTIEVPDGDIQTIANAHTLEVLTAKRLTLVEQQKALDAKIWDLNNED